MNDENKSRNGSISALTVWNDYYNIFTGKNNKTTIHWNNRIKSRAGGCS